MKLSRFSVRLKVALYIKHTYEIPHREHAHQLLSSQHDPRPASRAHSSHVHGHVDICIRALDRRARVPSIYMVAPSLFHLLGFHSPASRPPLRRHRLRTITSFGWSGMRAHPSTPHPCSSSLRRPRTLHVRTSRYAAVSTTDVCNVSFGRGASARIIHLLSNWSTASARASEQIIGPFAIMPAAVRRLGRHSRRLQRPSRRRRYYRGRACSVSVPVAAR